MNASKPMHPTFDELAALTVDELPAARAEEVREHLIGCPDCLAQVRELLTLSDVPPSPESDLSEAEQAAAWQSLQAAIGEDQETPAKPGVPRPFTVLPGGGASVRSIPPARGWSLKNLAAMLAAAALGIVVGGFWFSGRNGDMRPVAWTSVESEETYRRSGGEDDIQPLCPKGDRALGLLFAMKSGETPAVAWVRLANSAGTILIGYEELEPDDHGTMGLVIEKELPDGRYDLLVQRETRSAPAEKYPFRVECRP